MNLRKVISLLTFMGSWWGAWGQSIGTPLPTATETKLRAPVVGDVDSVYHEHETLVNVQFSQVQLSQWAAGGQGSASLIAKLDQEEEKTWGS